MPRKKRSTPDAASVPAWTPGGSLTIEHAAEYWSAAAGTLTTAAGGHVDLSAVDRVDSAGLQLLIAVRRTLEQRGLVWRLTGCSPGVVETIGQLGATEILGIETQTERRGRTS
jgi:anti-anti-sigma regulatory factor